MAKKLTIEFVREQFEKEGYTLLTETYINSKTPLEYICPIGHRGSVCWGSWQQKGRCLECSGKKKYTIEFIRAKFEGEGCILLTKKYINSKQKLKYICSKGHVEKISWNSWKQGHRCKKCAYTKNSNKSRHKVEFIKKEFKKEGYIALVDKYTNARTCLGYICPNGHNGFTCWHNWQQGKRCIECSGKKKYTIKFIREQFEKEGYELLTKKYKNCFEDLKYICPKGHKGSMRWHNWQHGARCQECCFENRKGKGNPNWNPNLTDEDRQDRRIIQGYDEWRFAVYNRDNHKCQVCEKRGEEAHHIESYNSNPDLRTTLSNGVCLCEKCHKDFHHQYGYGDNTREQFIEFINKYNKQEKLANV